MVKDRDRKGGDNPLLQRQAALKAAKQNPESNGAPVDAATADPVTEANVPDEAHASIGLDNFIPYMLRSIDSSVKQRKIMLDNQVVIAHQNNEIIRLLRILADEPEDAPIVPIPQAEVEETPGDAN